MDPRFEERIPNFVKQIQYIFMWYLYVYINDKVDKYTDALYQCIDKYSQTSFIRTAWYQLKWVRIVKHADYWIIVNRKW